MEELKNIIKNNPCQHGHLREDSDPNHSCLGKNDHPNPDLNPGCFQMFVNCFQTSF